MIKFFEFTAENCLCFGEFLSECVRGFLFVQQVVLSKRSKYKQARFFVQTMSHISCFQKTIYETVSSCRMSCLFLVLN